MLVALAEAAPPEEVGLVGAGPIEELVARRAGQFDSADGQELLDELDAAARRSARFRSELAFADLGDVRTYSSGGPRHAVLTGRSWPSEPSRHTRRRNTLRSGE